jgi:hypothetical protein
MAYVDNTDNEDEIGASNSTAKTAAPTTDDSALSSSGPGLVNATTAPAASAEGATTEKATDPSQSGWQDLSAYLNANSDQAGQMGDKLASGIDSQAKTAQDSISDLSNTFNSQTQSGYANLNTDQSAIDAAAADPTTYANDAGKYSQIQNDLSGTYSGPNKLSDLSGYAGVTSNINAAQNSLGLTSTEAGRDQLLKTNYARPDYNQGEQNLDQLLLENSPAAQSSISNVKDKWSGLSSNLASATTSAQALAQANQQAALDTQAYSQNAFNTAIGNQQNTLVQRASDANATRTGINDQYAQLKAALASGAITQAQATQLGLPTSDFYSNGTNLAAYLNGQNDNIANTSNVSTADDAAHMAALYKLSNQANTFYTDPTQIGTFKQNAIGLDPSALTNLKNVQDFNNSLNGVMIAPPGSYQDSVAHTINYYKQIGVLDANGNVPVSEQVFLAQHPDATPNQWLPLIQPYLDTEKSLFKVSS